MRFRGAILSAFLGICVGAEAAQAQCSNQGVGLPTAFQQSNQAGPILPGTTLIRVTGNFDGNPGSETGVSPDGFPIIRIDAAGPGIVTFTATNPNTTFTFNAPAQGQYFVILRTDVNGATYVPGAGAVAFTVVSGPAPISASPQTRATAGNPGAGFPLVQAVTIPGAAIFASYAGNCSKPSGGEDFSKIARLSQDLSALEIGSFHEREGAIYSEVGRFYAWSRAFGQTRGDDSNTLMRGLQAGVGFAFPGTGGIKTRLSAFASFGDGSANFSRGSANLEHRGGGLIGTLLAPDGAYLDVVGKVSDMSAGYRSAGTTVAFGGTSYSASAEVGVPWRPAPGTKIEPQAQIVYQNAGFGGATYAFDAFTNRAVSSINGDSLRGRFGVRLSQAGATPGNGTWEIWGRADLWHEFLGSNEVTVTDSCTSLCATASSASANFNSSSPNTWVDLTLGYTAKSENGIHLSPSVKASVDEHGVSFSGGASVRVVF